MTNLNIVLSKCKTISGELNALMNECAMELNDCTDLKKDYLPEPILKWVNNVYIDSHMLLYSINTLNSVNEFSELLNNNKNENNNNDDDE